MSTFQIVVLGIFSTLILVGIGVFAAFGGVLGNSGNGPVTVWGTIDTETMSGLIEALHGTDKSFESVTYVEKNPITYNSDLVSAMAAGNGPDLFMLPGEDLQSFSDKILVIPYGVISQGSYLSSYVDGAQLFLTPQGELALPFTIDPLVMYWNRDLFASGGVASPPRLWGEFVTLAPKITSLDARAGTKKSTVALGEWRNIPNAKAILSALFMQAGDSVVVRNTAGTPTVVLGYAPDTSTGNPAESALRFYTEFADPIKKSYSWNRSLPSAPDMFSAGDLAVYFGFASEYGGIAERNPNLRFSVAPLPQISETGNRLTYGKIMGLAIPKSAANIKGALAIAKKLSDKSAVSLISGALSLPPVRRDVAVDTTTSASASVFVQSSLIARAWLEPDAGETNAIFETMIESVVSGKLAPATAVSEAAQTLSQLFSR